MDQLYRGWGKEAWLFGKGPSFERVDWSEVGHPRVAVNDAALAVPDCDYMVATDPWSKWFEAAPAEVKGRCVAVTTDQCSKPYDGSGAQRIRPPQDWWLWCPFLPYYKPYPGPYNRTWYMAHGRLNKSQCSAVPALHLCWVLGAERVYGWGFDGGHEYGRTWKTKKHQPGDGLFDLYLELLQELADFCEVCWINKGKESLDQ